VLPCRYDPPTKYYIYVFWFINFLEPIKIHSFRHRWR